MNMIFILKLKKMNKLKLGFLIIIFTLSYFNLSAHKRAKYNIVIDSDGKLEDFRTISLFTASLDFNINCITSVEGKMPANKTANLLKNLLKIYHHEGILIGEGNEKTKVTKHDNHILEFLYKLFGKSEESFENAIDILGKAIENERKRTIIIALGPLTNIAKMLDKYPDNIIKTEMILWYSDYENLSKDFNYSTNKKAYEEILKMQIPIKFVSSNKKFYSQDFPTFIKEINSNYAKIFKSLLDFQKIEQNEISKELTSLYLLYPSIFDETKVGEFAINLKLKENSEPEILISSILNSDKPQASVIFNEIPTSGYMIMKDIEKYSEDLISKHGYNEFKITALCSEIHSHIGIYNILGAKLGLRIMEYLHAGLDEIQIVSYAGYQPPISCFNDGLQVGTGSTIGYGTISVDTTKEVQPALMVIYNNRKILFKIKPEIVEMAANDIAELVKKHGLESEMYWNVLREISIEKYWLNISRYDLAEIEELKE